MTDQSPYAETYCPHCGADEPSWNGNHADPEWLDIFEKHDAEVARLRAALKPFAAAVFNDNGDMTIDHAGIGIDQFAAAYFAMKGTAR